MRPVRIVYPRDPQLKETELRILRKIAWWEQVPWDGCSISQLAVADRLRKRGYIASFAENQFNRQHGWHLTVKGRDLLARERLTSVEKMLS